MRIRSLNAQTDYPKLHLGTAPDSWGVWMPTGDPRQLPWGRYLDEVQRAGYRYSELGPFGYLPTDPAIIREEYAKRGLTLTGGTVSVALHKGREALAKARADVDAAMAVIGPLGARHVVILPEGYTDLQGNLTGPTTLTDDEWMALTTGMSELGTYLADNHDAILVFHTHADSNVGTQEEIERFLDGTDPATVQLCLDTGHVAYCGADNLKIIRDYPNRIQYVHLKQIDPAIRARVEELGLGFAPAVRLGAMVEPPLGEPDMPSLLAALAALDRDLFCIVEQDMYPCEPDRPLPIAIRTREYFASCGLAAGRPLVAAATASGRDDRT
jgi:inosose dehydratase